MEQDELLFVNASLGNLDNSYIVYEWKLDSVKVPVMLMSYVGALKAYLYTPAVRFLPASPALIRLPMVFVGLFAALVTYLLLRCIFDRQTAAIAIVLILTDPSYIFQIRLDWGPVALMMFLKMASLYCFVKFTATNHRAFLAAGSFLLGLGVYDKANFLWYVVALAVATLAVWPRRVLRLFTFSSTMIVSIFFLLGCWPLLVYNIVTKGETFRGRLILPEVFWQTVLYRTGLLIEVLNGTAVYRYVNGQLPVHWSKSLLLDSSATLTPLLLVLVVVVLVGTGMRRSYPDAVWFFVVLACGIQLQIYLTFRPIGWHHIMMLYPFPQIVLAYVIHQFLVAESGRVFCRLGRTRHLIAVLGLGMLVLSNLVMNARFVKTFICERGKHIWSDAIYDLANYCIANNRMTYLLMDWGANNQLLFLSKGAVEKEEIFWELLDPLTDEDVLVEKLYERAKKPNSVFVFREQPYVVHARPARIFSRMLEKHHLIASTIQVFFQRDRRPLFRLQTVSKAS